MSGKTASGRQLFSADNKLSREEALRLYTLGSAWFSQEEGVEGKIAIGQLADFSVLSKDYLSVAEEEIKTIESVLTIVGGRPVYGALPFEKFNPSLPTIFPQWSPLKSLALFTQNQTELMKIFLRLIKNYCLPVTI